VRALQRSQFLLQWKYARCRVARKIEILPQLQADLACPVPSRENNPLNPSGKSPLQARPIPPERGAFRDRHECGAGCGGRKSAGAQMAVAGRLFNGAREQPAGARTNGADADGEVVWSCRPALFSSAKERKM
jgi:hypothetical protein